MLPSLSLKLLLVMVWSRNELSSWIANAFGSGGLSVNAPQKRFVIFKLDRPRALSILSPHRRELFSPHS